MKTSKFISVPDEGYPEIPNLIYYRSIENGIYFDAIYYLKQSGLMGQRNVDDFLNNSVFRSTTCAIPWVLTRRGLSSSMRRPETQ